MGWRFQRRRTLVPGLRLNVGERGASVRVGPRGAGITAGRRGIAATVSLLGTDLAYAWRRRRPPR